MRYSTAVSCPRQPSVCFSTTSITTYYLLMLGFVPLSSAAFNIFCYANRHPSPPSPFPTVTLPHRHFRLPHRMEVASLRPDYLPTLSAAKTSKLSLVVKSPFGGGAAEVGNATPTSHIYTTSWRLMRGANNNSPTVSCHPHCHFLLSYFVVASTLTCYPTFIYCPHCHLQLLCHYCFTLQYCI